MFNVFVSPKRSVLHGIFRKSNKQHLYCLILHNLALKAWNV